MAMLRLPDEMLQSIFCNLLPSSDMYAASMSQKPPGNALAALCRTNRRCLSIAQPLLYHTILLRPMWCLGREHVLSLAERFAQHPQFAGYVHVLHIQLWKTAQNTELIHPEGLPFKPLEESMFKHFETATKTMHPVLAHHATRLLEAVRQRSQDAVLAFLLALCQNIEVLDIELPICFNQSYVHGMLRHFIDTGVSEPIRHSAQNTIGLPKLRELQLRHGDIEGAESIYDIATIMGKSSLNVFRGDMIDMTNMGLGHRFHVQPWSLRCVILTDSLVDSSGVTTLLQCCPELESLSIHWASAIVGTLYNMYLNEFGEAFRKYGQNLQNIDLDVKNLFYRDYHDDPDTRLLGSLTTLTKLTRLGVPQLALLSVRGGANDAEDRQGSRLPTLVEVIPPSLRTLNIHKCNKRFENQDLDSHLLDLMSSKRFCKLRTIRIGRPRIFSQKDALPKLGWNSAAGDRHWIELRRIESTI